MAAATAIGTLLKVVVAAAAVSGAVSAGKARREQKRSNALARKSQKLKSKKGAIEQVRQAQIARADVLQQGENTGVGGSSLVSGSTGSIQSQAGGNIGFANTIFGLQNSIQRLRQSANSLQGVSSGFRAIGTLASNFTPSPA